MKIELLNELFKKKKIFTMFNNTHLEIICRMTNKSEYDLLIAQTIYPLH